MSARRPSEEYQTVPLEEDGDFPIHNPSTRSTGRSINTKHIIMIILSIAVSIYFVILFSQSGVHVNDLSEKAKSALALACPSLELDSSLTNDQRIDQLLYQSYKNAIMLGDEEQAQQVTKQLIQSFKAQNLPQSNSNRHVTPPIEEPAKKSTTQPPKQTDHQSAKKPAKSTDDLADQPVDLSVDLDTAVARRVESKTSQEWRDHYVAEEYQPNGYVKRDGWHIVGSYAFNAPGCQRMGDQCSANSPEAAQKLCDSHDECLGYVCNKGRSDCQLRVKPITHQQQESIISYYKNAQALAAADIRAFEHKAREDALMKPGSTASKGFNFKGVCGKDGYKCVISYGLYGSNPKYGEGAIENVKLLDTQFPGWVIRIYHDATVPQELLIRLAEMGCELNHVDSAVESGSIAGMFWRFLIAEDETVDRYIIRDSDSRLNPREKAAVDEWLASGFSIHTIRDHPNHDRPLNGGMWGGSKGSLLNIRELIQSSSRNGYGADLTFLTEKVWPIVQYDQIGHDSYSCHKYINSHPFPTKRPDDYQHVGQVFEDNKPRMGDITGFLIGNPAPMQCRKHPDWLYG